MVCLGEAHEQAEHVPRARRTPGPPESSVESERGEFGERIPDLIRHPVQAAGTPGRPPGRSPRREHEVPGATSSAIEEARQEDMCTSSPTIV